MDLFFCALPGGTQSSTSWGLGLKNLQNAALPCSFLVSSPLAFWIPVGLKRLMLVALTNINLQSPGCNFTLCCVHKLISWD